MREHPGPHAPLHALTDGPVLPVYPIPKRYRIGGIEVWLLQFLRMKEEVADNGRVAGVDRPNRVSGHMLRREAETEVGVDQLPFMTNLLVLVEPFKRAAPRSP